MSDNHNYYNHETPHSLAINSCMLRPKCRQPYVHNSNDDHGNSLPTALGPPPLPPLPKQPSPEKSANALNRDMEKQQQLSDWYYIKSNPKSPRLPPRPEKRTPLNTNVTNATKRSPIVQREYFRYNGAGKSENAHIINNDNKSNSHEDERHGENLENPNCQLPVKFHSRCNEKLNGYPSPVHTIERERQPSQHSHHSQHEEQLPVYQQLSQHQQHLQHPQYPNHQRLTVASGMRQNVPDYENHQIATNFQQYHPHHANYSPRNRFATTANTAVPATAIITNHSCNNNNNNNISNVNSKNNNNNINKAAMGHASPVAIARFGEMTSSSFEHVNVTNFLPDMIGSEKQYRSTSNFSNERDLMDEHQLKSMSARRRAVPPVPVQASPNQTVSLL